MLNKYIVTLLSAVLCTLVLASTHESRDVQSSAGLPPVEAERREEATPNLTLTPKEREWLQGHRVIRLGIDRNFSPYEWIDSDGNYVGIAADYMHLLEQRLDIQFEVVKDKQSWADVLASARRGEVDMLSSLVKTPEREQFLIFSSPYIAGSAVIISELSNGYVGTLEQLSGKSVAIHKGHFTQELLAKNHPDISIISTNSLAEALHMVADGKADAFVGDASAASYIMKKEGLLNLTFSGYTKYKSEFSLGVLMSNPELSTIMEKALATITQKEKDVIYNHWRGLKIDQGISAETIIKYGAAFLLLLLLFAYWVYRLRGEISDRQRAEKRERSHNRVLELLSKGASLEEVLETIVTGVEQENPEMLCSILLLDQEGKHLQNGAAPSLPGFYNEAIDGLEIGPGVGSCGAAAFSGERVIVDDIQTHPYWKSFKGLAAKASLGSCWSEPIKDASGAVLGTFAIYHHQPGSPSLADIQLIERVSGLAGISIERIRANELIWVQANLDPLTKLPNRSMFPDRLEQAIKKAHRSGQQVALLYLDLDNFKEVNDMHGHDVGDELLKEAADRLSNCVREADTVARLGGG